MKKYLFLLTSIILFFGNISPSFGSCPENARKLLGISENDIYRTSSKYNCADILYLKKKGILDLPFSDYLNRYPDSSKIQQLRRKGITPDKALIFKNDSVSKIFRTLKKQFLEFHHITYNPSQQTFFSEKGNGKQCSQPLTVLSALKNSLEPSYFSGNYIYNIFQERLGEIKPLENEKAKLILGEYEKEITWDPECYKEETISSFVNVFQTCWLCPVYDFFYQAVAIITYKVWNLLRRPLLLLIVFIFPLLLGFNILKKLIGFEITDKDNNYIKKTLLPMLLKISLITIIVVSAEAGFDIIYEFITLILEPISVFAVELSERFLNKDTCEYIPLSVNTAEFMFSASLKNDLLCVVEHLMSVFVDYLILSGIIIIKSFGIIFSWSTLLSVINPLELGKIILTFLFTFLLGVWLFFSFIREMWKVLFYLIDPIFNMGMVFVYLPFALLRWVFGEDIKIQAKNFSDLFKTIFNSFVVMVFTSLVVSLCGTILLGIMTSSDKLVQLREAIQLGTVSSMWSTIDVSSTMPLRLVIGILIVQSLIRNIPDYAKKFTGQEIKTEIYDNLKKQFKVAYVDGKKRYKTVSKKIKSALSGLKTGDSK